MDFVVPGRISVTTSSLLVKLLIRHPYDFEKPNIARGFMRRFLDDRIIIAEGDNDKTLRENGFSALYNRHVQNLCPFMWRKAHGCQWGAVEALAGA